MVACDARTSASAAPPPPSVGSWRSRLASRAPRASVSSRSCPTDPPRAGIRAGDLLVSLDTMALATLSDLQRAVVADRIGRAADLAYVRLGELRRTTITPVEAR